jgi:hypothetical protein
MPASRPRVAFRGSIILLEMLSARAAWKLCQFFRNFLDRQAVWQGEEEDANFVLSEYSDKQPDVSSATKPSYAVCSC